LAGQTISALSKTDVVIDRINRALMKLIARRTGSQSTIHVNPTGVRSVEGSETHWNMSWPEIRCVTAFRSAGFVGESLVIALEGLADRRLVTEEQPGWQELVVALPKYLPGALHYERWATTIAWGDENSLTVYARE
jgi:hypothetical protein